MKTFADLLDERAIAVESVVRRLKIGRTAVYYWRSGEKMPRVQARAALARMLQITPRTLLSALREGQRQFARQERRRVS